jgi:hypothetical protein
VANNNEAHTALVRAALQELAVNGYTAWQNSTGVWFDDDGRPHKYGKVGSADIYCILPPHGRHCEFEAKTGTGKQSINQEKHQKYVVERNGGIYILFRSVSELISAISKIRS